MIYEKINELSTELENECTKNEKQIEITEKLQEEVKTLIQRIDDFRNGITPFFEDYASNKKVELDKSKADQLQKLKALSKLMLPEMNRIFIDYVDKYATSVNGFFSNSFLSKCKLLSLKKINNTTDDQQIDILSYMNGFMKYLP